MSDCILWTHCIGQNGYGQKRRDGRTQYAHRLAWIDTYGPIPDGLFVCHTCDMRACVNPEHLFLGTHTDNMRDAMVKGRTHRPVGQTWTRGSRNGNSVLTEEQVMAIYAAEGTQTAIAAQYGVSRRLIGMIRNGTRWTHVTSPRQDDVENIGITST